MVNPIENEDLEIIKELAQKYSMSLGEFGKTITILSKGTTIYKQMRVSRRELDIIVKKAKRLKLKQTDMYILCYRKGIQKENYESIDISKINEQIENETKNICVNVRFTNNKELLQVQNIAEKLGVRVGTLLRYFALHVEP